MENYIIETRETGTMIDYATTLEEAIKMIKLYEKADKDCEYYTPNYYLIRHEIESGYELLDGDGNIINTIII